MELKLSFIQFKMTDTFPPHSSLFTKTKYMYISEKSKTGLRENKLGPLTLVCWNLGRGSWERFLTPRAIHMKRLYTIN